jgi:hypothetical protein
MAEIYTCCALVYCNIMCSLVGAHQSLLFHPNRFLFVDYFATLSVATLYSVKFQEDTWITLNWKEVTMAWGSIPFSRTDWKNCEKNSVKLPVSPAADIRTMHLPSTGQECYHNGNLFSSCHRDYMFEICDFSEDSSITQHSATSQKTTWSFNATKTSDYHTVVKILTM